MLDEGAEGFRAGPQDRTVVLLQHVIGYSRTGNVGSIILGIPDTAETRVLSSMGIETVVAGWELADKLDAVFNVSTWVAPS